MNFKKVKCQNFELFFKSIMAGKKAELHSCDINLDEIVIVTKLRDYLYALTTDEIDAIMEDYPELVDMAVVQMSSTLMVICEVSPLEN